MCIFIFRHFIETLLMLNEKRLKVLLHTGKECTNTQTTHATGNSQTTFERRGSDMLGGAFDQNSKTGQSVVSNRVSK